MPGTVTGNLWLDAALGLLGFAVANAGLAMLLGWKPPLQDRLPAPGAALGALMLALGMGFVAFFGHPDLVERAVRTLAGS